MLNNKSPFIRGDIWLARYHPAVGSEQKRFRPIVIVSDLSYVDSRYVLTVPFTTSLKNFNPNYEFIVSKNDTLNRDSRLLCWYLRTLDARRIEKRLGKLNETDLEKLMDSIVGQFYVDDLSKYLEKREREDPTS